MSHHDQMWPSASWEPAAGTGPKQCSERAVVMVDRWGGLSQGRESAGGDLLQGPHRDRRRNGEGEV